MNVKVNITSFINKSKISFMFFPNWILKYIIISLCIHNVVHEIKKNNNLWIQIIYHDLNQKSSPLSSLLLFFIINDSKYRKNEAY